MAGAILPVRQVKRAPATPNGLQVTALPSSSKRLVKNVQSIRRRYKLKAYSKTWPRFSSATRIQIVSFVRRVTARSVASCAALNGVDAFTTCVAVTTSPFISSTSYLGKAHSLLHSDAWRWRL